MKQIRTCLHAVALGHGRYLLFQSLRDNRWDLWVLRDRIGVFGNSRVLVPLTNGPLSYTNPIVSRDGRRIFAVGTKRRGELTRYDEKSAHFVPYLSGISAADPTFSRDGKWVAYRSYPDGTLWRSRTDGTERLQLTYAPISFPVISPDGSRVAFEVDTGTTFDKGGIYIVSTQGGSPQRVADSCTAATWSPNSNLLVLSCWTSGKQPDGTERVELRIADVFSGKISPIRDSEGKCCAFWADQHTIVAALDDQTKFFTFDLTVQKWIELASGLFVNWFISPDGKYLNYTTGGTEPAAHRLRLSNRSTAHIVDLKGFRRAVDSKGSTQLNVAPDGSLLFTRDIGSQEIYALDVKWP